MLYFFEKMSKIIIKTDISLVDMQRTTSSDDERIAALEDEVFVCFFVFNFYASLDFLIKEPIIW